MVITRIVGGLGNQMFQYAAGLRLSQSIGLPLKLDLESFKSYWRPFGLSDWKIEAGVATSVEIESLRGPPATIAERVLRRGLGIRTGPASCFRERSLAFDRSIEQIDGPVYLQGYWQDERYFVDATDTLRSHFTPRVPLGAEATCVLERILASESVSVHVRRGDYLRKSRWRPSTYCHCTPDYYRRAIQLIADRLGSPTVFLFSDDIEWCRHVDFGPHRIEFVTLPRDIPPMVEMFLMSRCLHAVIANSTYSWWGAWLNSNPSKVVVGPKQWFRSWRHRWISPVCRTWIRL